ncbi:MAG: tetratricopeptide repeat protein [Candidatus Acidiferrales bacterium]
MTQRFTRREVGRILGVEPSRLRYWERLRLVRPRSRWGERFYGFGDLVALRTLQRLTARHISARRVRSAVASIEQEFGSAELTLNDLTLVDRGGCLAVVPPGATAPFDPLRRQWLLAFEIGSAAGELRAMAPHTPDALFQRALDCESDPETLPEAVANYRRVIDAAPNWVEAHINMGVALYQMGCVADAQAAFESAVRLDPENGISRYNLGCVLEEQGEIEAAVEHLREAASLMPSHADVHFNLALAYDKRGERQLAREEWSAYLRYAPNGPWAEEARRRLRQYLRSSKPSAPIPFPRKA